MCFKTIAPGFHRVVDGLKALHTDTDIDIGGGRISSSSRNSPRNPRRCRKYASMIWHSFCNAILSDGPSQVMGNVVTCPRSQCWSEKSPPTRPPEKGYHEKAETCSARSVVMLIPRAIIRLLHPTCQRC